MSDLPFALPDIGPAETAGVLACLNSGWLTSGLKVQEFEKAFAAEIGVTHAISCSSATDAALLVMEALGVGPGVEVVVPVWTFSGPAMMAHKLGAKVVFCDVDLDTYCMTVETLSKVVTSRTLLVMPTHFAGRSCDMTELLSYCNQLGILVVDDAAHAFPTTDEEGRKVGAQGAAATFFSFYATKTLTTGEGGMIVTEDDKLAKALSSSRCHGISRNVFDRYVNAKTGWRYDVAQEGWKANMTDVAAAIGLAQLARSKELHLTRSLLAQSYTNAFTAGDMVELCRPPDMSAGHAWHLYPLRVFTERDRFISEMRQLGVMCSMHFIPLHHHSFWQGAAANAEAYFPMASVLADQEVSLPLFSKMSEVQLARVIDASRAVLLG
jgi:dTDP-4-amino-4,6-dideoxygalactose transaminase